MAGNDRYLFAGTSTGVWRRPFSEIIGIKNITNSFPEIFKLFQNYPNPFNPATKIKFDIPKPSYVKFTIYNTLGEEITTLVNQQLNSGTYEVNFDASNFPSSDGAVGGVFRTTNAGANWTQQLNIGANNPGKIYMYNARIGFVSTSINDALYRTTNSGVNWFQITGEIGFTDMYFADSLTGWKCKASMKKTTDGGTTWQTQILSMGGIITGSGMSRFSVLNRDTIWGVGGTVEYPNLQDRGTIYRTTNGGNS